MFISSPPSFLSISNLGIKNPQRNVDLRSGVHPGQVHYSFIRADASRETTTHTHAHIHTCRWLRHILACPHREALSWESTQDILAVRRHNTTVQPEGTVTQINAWHTRMPNFHHSYPNPHNDAAAIRHATLLQVSAKTEQLNVIPVWKWLRL